MREAKKSMRPNNSGDRKIMLTQQWSFFFFFFFNLMKQGLVLHQKTLYIAENMSVYELETHPGWEWTLSVRSVRHRRVALDATQATAKRHEKAHVSIFSLLLFFFFDILCFCRDGKKRRIQLVTFRDQSTKQKKQKNKDYLSLSSLTSLNHKIKKNIIWCIEMMQRNN